jgi:uncharacterized protein (TIGR03067 family)
MTLHGLTALTAALGLGWLATVTAPADDVKKDLDALQGTLTIKDDKYEAMVAGMTIKATIKVDGSKTPRAIDFMYTEGPGAGETIKGVYAIEGETLRIYRPLEPGGDRPGKVASEPAEGMLLITYKRDKP